MIFGVLALIVVILLIATTIYAAVIAAPFVPTPKITLTKALEALSLKPGEKFYDLGSGTGESLILAVKKFGSKGVGYELSLPVYFYSKFKVLISGCRENVSIYWKNFYNENISDADAVFCWLTPKAFRKLEEKFNRELKPGTRIATFSSPLLFWKPEKIIDLESDGKLFLYRKK